MRCSSRQLGDGVQRRRYCAASPSTALSPSQGSLPEQRMPNASWETAPDGTIRNQPEHPNLFRRELKLGLQQQLVINTILQRIGTNKQAKTQLRGCLGALRACTQTSATQPLSCLQVKAQGAGRGTKVEQHLLSRCLLAPCRFKALGGRDSPPRTLSSRLSPVHRALSSRPP